MPKHLFSFGHGYSARAITARLDRDDWAITGTVRTQESADAITALGVTPLVVPRDDIAEALHAATHLLVSAAPDVAGDPMLRDYHDVIAAAPSLKWVGYLSTTGVYGDHGGAWVDEATPLTPATKRGQARVEAEAKWSAFCTQNDFSLAIFRLAGIYGPGRGPFAKLLAGTARRIIKADQVFSRIHVDDIAQAVASALNRPDSSGVYNICDNDPAPPQDVLGHAAELLGLPLPAEEDFETAEMSPMARSFYAESKKVRNDKMKAELGVELIYPTYAAGLKALLAQD